MTVLHIDGGRVLTNEGPLRRQIVVDGERIAAVSEQAGRADSVVDGEGLIVAPGFVDIQINGGFGISLEREPECVWDLARLLPQHGVTSFLPTIVSSPAEAREGMINALQHRPDGAVGAEPLGVHFEGPMLAPLRRGAHRADMLASADLDVIEGWSRSDGVVVATIAPELPGAIAIVEELVRRGVVIALGHTDATNAESRLAVNAGATLVTHLFNAMSPLRHREPGLVGLTLADRRLVAGMIVDGIHIDPTVVAAAWNAKGPAGIVLVTDAVSAMGQKLGGQKLGGHQVGGSSVTVTDGAVRDARGTLAGSTLTMNQAIKNLVAFTGCRPVEALDCASRNPATAIGASDRGTLAAGAIADVVFLDDDLNVQITICAGRLAYVAESARYRVPPGLIEGDRSWKS